MTTPHDPPTWTSTRPHGGSTLARRRSDRIQNTLSVRHPNVYPPFEWGSRSRNSELEVTDSPGAWALPSPAPHQAPRPTTALPSTPCGSSQIRARCTPAAERELGRFARIRVVAPVRLPAACGSGAHARAFAREHWTYPSVTPLTHGEMIARYGRGRYRAKDGLGQSARPAPIGTSGQPMERRRRRAAGHLARDRRTQVRGALATASPPCRISESPPPHRGRANRGRRGRRGTPSLRRDFGAEDVSALERPAVAVRADPCAVKNRCSHTLRREGTTPLCSWPRP